MHKFPPSHEDVLDSILIYSRGQFSRRKPREARPWCQIECLRLNAVPIKKGRIWVVVEQGRDVTGLPVDDSRNFFGILRVNEGIAIMQVIMPDAGSGDGCLPLELEHR